jgi:hypothetical protein
MNDPSVKNDVEPSITEKETGGIACNAVGIDDSAVTAVATSVSLVDKGSTQSNVATKNEIQEMACEPGAPADSGTYVVPAPNVPVAAALVKPSSPKLSDWELFLSGKGGTADKFIKKMEKKAISWPTDTELRQCAGLAWSSSKSMAKLRDLLLASRGSKLLQRHALALGSSALLHNPIQSYDTCGGLDNLLIDLQNNRIFLNDKRRLEFVQLALIWLWCQTAVNEQQIVKILSLQLLPCSLSPGSSTSDGGEPPRNKEPMELLLAAGCNPKIWLGSLEVAKAWHYATVKQADNLEQLKQSATTLAADRIEIQTQLKAAQSEATQLMAAMEQAKIEAMQAQAEYEQKRRDIISHYQYQLDTTKARLRGILSGRLSLLIRTASEAAQEPPHIEVVREKLEDALALIKQEAANV